MFNQSNTDGSDSDYMPADMTPIGFEDVPGVLWLALALCAPVAGIVIYALYALYQAFN